MQYSLDILAQEIRVDMARRTNGDQEWKTGTLNLCVHLAQARACFPDNIGFGQWFDAQGFKIGHQDRAAAIAMGRNAERLREVLADTTSHSLQLICRQGFTNTGKPRLTSNSKTTNRASEEKRDRAFAAYDRRKAAGEELTLTAVQAEAGVSNTVVRAVFTTRQTQEQAEADTIHIATETEQEAARQEFLRPLYEEVLAHIAKLTGAERKRWDKRVESFKWQLEHDASAKASAKFTKWKEETGVAYFDARCDKIEGLLAAWPHSALRRNEYNILLRCIHPDTARNQPDDALNEAFRILSTNKLRLVNDEEERIVLRRELTGVSKMSLQEMLARRKTGKVRA